MDPAMVFLAYLILAVLFLISFVSVQQSSISWWNRPPKWRPRGVRRRKSFLVYISNCIHTSLADLWNNLYCEDLDRICIVTYQVIKIRISVLHLAMHFQCWIITGLIIRWFKMGVFSKNVWMRSNCKSVRVANNKNGSLKQELKSLCRENETYRRRNIQNTIQLKGKQKIIVVERCQLQRSEKDCLMKS